MLIFLGDVSVDTFFVPLENSAFAACPYFALKSFATLDDAVV